MTAKCHVDTVTGRLSSNRDFFSRPRLANGPVSVRFDGKVLRVIDGSGVLLELHDCAQIAVQLPQFPLELFEQPSGSPRA